MTEFALTPAGVRAIIKDRYPGLLASKTLAVGYKDNILKLSGSIMAVSAMDRHVMQKLIPTHCKPMEKMEGNMDRSAVYTYKF